MCIPHITGNTLTGCAMIGDLQPFALCVNRLVKCN